MISDISVTPGVKGVLIGNSVEYVIEAEFSGSSGNSATINIMSDSDCIALSRSSVTVSGTSPRATFSVAGVSEGEAEITIGDTRGIVEDWCYSIVVDLSEFIIPVTNRQDVRTRTSANDINRICKDLNILRHEGLDESWKGRIITAPQWQNICSTVNDLAFEMGIDEITEDTDYASFNRLESVILQYKEYLEGE